MFCDFDIDTGASLPAFCTRLTRPLFFVCYSLVALGALKLVLQV